MTHSLQKVNKKLDTLHYKFLRVVDRERIRTFLKDMVDTLGRALLAQFARKSLETLSFIQ